jgi:DNA uptake protein ComE-like DNA-binding protein
VAQYAAESGILATLTTLQTIVDSAPQPVALAARTRHLDTLGRRVAADQAAGASQFAVAVLDLNARLDLAHTDSLTLRALFGQFVSSERAAGIVGALRRTPVTRFGELARVEGASDALALAVAPYVTVGSDGLVDVNAAPEAVLAALPGIGAAKAQAFVARRDAGELFTSTDAFRPAQGGVSVQGILLTIAPTRLMIVSRGWQRGSPLTHEIQAVYLVLGGRLTLQSWEERDR